jgi:hypothetical protein
MTYREKIGEHKYARQLAYNRKWMKRKRDTNIAQREKDRTYRQSPLGRVRVALSSSRNAARRRGHAPCISTPDELLPTLTDNCEMCGRHTNECGPLCLDHDHQNGNFRGWLCRSCNTSLGHYESIKDLAGDYLLKK